MRKLYCINRSGSNPTTIKLFKESTKEKGIALTLVDSDTFDYTTMPNLGEGDMLYNICTDRKSKNIERLLINNKCSTFYRDWHSGIYHYDNVIEAGVIHQKMGLPIIPTIFDATNDRLILEKYADQIGGFPLIIKLVNGSHGVGVIKVDSLDSLFSIVDVLTGKGESFILRQYIDYIDHARLIVLGEEVISSIEYRRVKKDFRSNVGNELDIVSKDYSQEIKSSAARAVQSLGFEFGGVDILIDKDQKFYIAEVNFPCFFPRTQNATGDDISGRMIDYLMNKEA